MIKKIWILLLPLTPVIANDADQWVNVVEEMIQNKKPDAFDYYQGLDTKDKAAFLQDFLRYGYYAMPSADQPLAETEMITAVLRKYAPQEVV